MSLNIPQLQVIDIFEYKTQKLTIEESFLKEKYLQEGLSSKEIAQVIFSSRATVTRHLQSCGIPLKKDTRRVNGGHVYGFRKYSGKSIEFKKEQKVIELIKSYRKDGYSYQKIAEHLNSNELLPKRGGKNWFSKVVRQIYLRNI